MSVGPWLTAMTLMWLFLGGTSLLAEGKWIVLFDGKSKDAWRGYQRQEFPDKGWVVDQGAFKTIVGGEHVDLVTKQKFHNFELELEWKVSPGGNGGIFYRAGEEDKEIWHSAARSLGRYLAFSAKDSHCCTYSNRLLIAFDQLLTILRGVSCMGSLDICQ